MLDSTQRPLLRILGSLKVGVVILSLLSLVLIAATIYESRTSTRQVQLLVYQSWWFSSLLGLLGLNVLSAAIARYPWRRRQLGFVLTHLGIVILLLGSIIGFLFGVEGSLSLVENGSPLTSYTQDYEVLQITQPDSGRTVSVPVRFQHQNPDSLAGRILKTTPFGFQTSIKAYHRNMRPVLRVANGGSQFNPALRFTVAARMLSSSERIETSEWLVLGDPQRRAYMLGPAVFKLDLASSAEALRQKMSPPSQDKPSGKGLLELTVNQKTVSVPIDANLGKEYRSPDDKITVKINEYFADFRMDQDSRRPTSVSDQPNNPAVMFEVTQGNDHLVGFAFADYPEMTLFRGQGSTNVNIQATYHFDRGLRDSSASTLTFLVGPDNRLYYSAFSSQNGFQAGELRLNDPLRLSWMSSFEVVINEFISQPLISTEFIPDESDPQMAGTFPALALLLDFKNQPQHTLVRWGDPTRVTLGTNVFELLFHYATRPLGFSVQLKKFDAPKYEGTSMPASFESHVRVVDLKTGDAIESRIWMNHPLTYQGYRISQASYEEGAGSTPNRSILQVVRDPGYLLKGAGSILIVLGIGIMFYYRPREKNPSSSPT